MALAHCLVETDATDIRPNVTTKVAAIEKAGNKFVDSNKKILKRANNFEDTTYHIQDMVGEQIKAPSGTEDLVVDVIDFKRNGDSRVAAKEDPYETECSSSFADTTSGIENCSGQSDAEVESQFDKGGSLASAFDGFGSLFLVRKRKLTGHWRSFIRPLMWRCKWAELKVKEFQSQAAKYARRLAAYDQIKHAAADQNTLEEYGSRSRPFSFQSYKRKPMKRRKRKEAENITDATLFMSNHYLFSYHESKKSDLDGTTIGDDFGKPGLNEQNAHGTDDFINNDDWPFLDDNNNIQEQTFRRIELVHSRVNKLKARLDSIMTRYACKFSSSESLTHLVPGDAQTSSIHSPTFSACNGDAVSVGGLCSPPHLPEYDFGDFIMADSVVSSYGEPILIPDVIESTVGLLSSADVTQQQAQVGDSCERTLDNVLIGTQSIQMEGQTLQKNNNQSAEKFLDSDNSGEDESINIPLPAASESNTMVKTSVSQEQSTLKSCLASDIHIPKNKRKRGERKAGSGGWNRQHAGEPDTQ